MVTAAIRRHAYAQVYRSPIDLVELGWSAEWQLTLDGIPHEGLSVARVVTQHRGGYGLLTADGEVSAQVSGKLRHASASAAVLPAVGDWVLVQTGTIHAVLPRRTRFSRQAAGGRTDEQIVAANVDTVFVVMGLDPDFNLRRLERYLVFAWESGAEPIVLLTKADLAADAAERLGEVESSAPGVPVLLLSSVTGIGIDAVAERLQGHRTYAFLGSSGAGKTTLINRLAGLALATGGLRKDGRGRHTTTRRELLILPGRAVILDTPGMRELQVWEATRGTQDAFADVGALASECRFSDCQHAGEPGCAVLAAVEAGTLDAARLASLRKLEREAAHARVQHDARAAAEARRATRALTRKRNRIIPK
ncbi:MAG: ribosome small subunit-dependent GTPase A [Candidatus Limnocylindrales bacterium]